VNDELVGLDKDLDRFIFMREEGEYYFSWSSWVSFLRGKKKRGRSRPLTEGLKEPRQFIDKIDAVIGRRRESTTPLLTARRESF
jgi:hypothetical protein